MLNLNLFIVLKKYYSLLLLCSVLTLLFITAVNGQTQSPITITHQPYIQGLTGTSVSVIWTTNRPAIAWVELAPDDSSHFYRVERPRFFATNYGFKNVGTVHQVNLEGLTPGTTYRYRVYSTEVLKHVGVNVDYGKTVATGVYQQAPLQFKTLGNSASTKFAVINDIHGRNEVMQTLLDHSNLPAMDFIVFNGDMANSLLSEDQMFQDFMDTAIKRFASEKPMYYARGNHETRGPFAVSYPAYFPTPTGKLYYQFRQGDAAFIVLDCGEDKPDSDMEYSGIVDMDNYRTQQAKWLAKAVEDPAFISARYKVVICHMPPFGGWHGELEILEKFVPILNKAGVQIMLSGHLHKHIIQKANNQVHFPIIVNSNNNLIQVDLNPSRGLFKVLDQQGKTVDEVLVKP
ncbi:metallophosphoesterase family protein [Sphingobacterium psychroaquaticum]|uniref:purple acid phosphatase family protein n=1 Tax=Sphingobacterium psychroaquaticum TaxID=561061 RepID=UPI00106BB0CA|nr:metallophosphoesterase family protein [Sphingobacterium psychroaquaticum]QBQ40997.1 metallophosphoesterase family protein [Sphingobacterium psychroaquaticum]